jgi:hypothetical protein
MQAYVIGEPGGPDFGKLREAHTMMDENRANGKIVIEVDCTTVSGGR